MSIFQKKTKKTEVKEMETIKAVESEKVEEKIEQPEKILETQKKITKIASRVLIRPIITEKATQTQNCYVFEVLPSANKIEIKKAIKELYNVEPIKINMVCMHGKKVRYGRSSGRTKNRKKALVFLKEGAKIEFAKKT